VTGSFRKLHNDLHNWHFSSNVIRMIVSMRMKWEGEGALMGETRNAYEVSGRNTSREETTWKI
jgi:hypothetical protein